MIKNFFKKSIVVSLLSLSICANSCHTYATPIPESCDSEQPSNINSLLLKIQNIKSDIQHQKAAEGKLHCCYIYFWNSEYKKLSSDLAEEKKELYKKAFEECDLKLKHLKESKKYLQYQLSIYAKAQEIFSALSNQLVCTMQMLDPENMQSQNPEEYAARNRNLYSYVSSNTFINLDLTCNKIQNLILEFSCCNDSSSNQIVQYMKILRKEILTLNKNIEQSNYHTYSFIYVPKLELVNWINHFIYYSRCLESLLR